MELFRFCRYYRPGFGFRKYTAVYFESRELRDLRSNPLILALMCNVYKTEGFIPRSRAELYDNCTNMLLFRLDKSIKQLEKIKTLV